MVKLKEVNSLYKDVRIDEPWESVNKENDPSLWNLLTSVRAENDELQTDSDNKFNAQENAEKKDQS